MDQPDQAQRERQERRELRILRINKTLGLINVSLFIILVLTHVAQWLGWFRP